MTGPELTEALLDAACRSLGELAVSLALQAPVVLGPVAELPEDGAGAVIPLVGAASFQLGIFGAQESCEALAKGVLGISTDDPADPSDIADAVCEAVNVIAGAAKMKLAARFAAGFDLKLGLPLFSSGRTHALRGASVAGCRVLVQSRPMTLLVIAA